MIAIQPYNRGALQFNSNTINSFVPDNTSAPTDNNITINTVSEDGHAMRTIAEQREIERLERKKGKKTLARYVMMLLGSFMAASFGVFVIGKSVARPKLQELYKKHLPSINERITNFDKYGRNKQYPISKTKEGELIFVPVKTTDNNIIFVAHAQNSKKHSSIVHTSIKNEETGKLEYHTPYLTKNGSIETKVNFDYEGARCIGLPVAINSRGKLRTTASSLKTVWDYLKKLGLKGNLNNTTHRHESKLEPSSANAGRHNNAYYKTAGNTVWDMIGFYWLGEIAADLLFAGEFIGAGESAGVLAL